MTLRFTLQITFQVISVLAVSTLSLASAADVEGIDFFEKKIRPVLSEHCYKCHSAKAGKAKAGLFLDRRAGWEVGGENGPAILPGKPEDSRLLTAIRFKNNDLRMPKSGKLPDPIIADFEKWIQMGAPDPRNDPLDTEKAHSGPQSKSLDEGRKFWSFKALSNPTPPAVTNKDWATSKLDLFILSKLEEQKILPTSAADKTTLLRRAYFDLTGLPPSAEQIETFLNNKSENAYEKLIDQLLQSSHYAERWARHWLDVARYADTTGGGRNLQFPNAYRYRNYVLDSYRDDKPYDLFVKQQIAGDLLPAQTDAEYNENLIGTTFLALGPHNYELQDKALLRMEIVDEQVSAVGRAFLGMTMGCARCHDHPFDPVPTAEYYALAGIFRSTNSSRPGNVANFIERELRDSSGEARKKHKIQADFLNKRLKMLEAELKELGGSPQKKSAKNHNPEKLDGIVIDDVASTKSGSWTKSTHTKGYVGEGYVHATGNGKSLTFNANIPRSGQYEVQVSYTPGPNRASNTQVTIFHDTGEKKISVNQKKKPSILGSFLSLGKFHFEKGEWDVVRISTDKSNGVVIGDSVRLLEINGLNTPPAITKGDTVKKTDAKSDDRKKELQQNIASIKKEIESHKKTVPPKAGKTMSVEEHSKTEDWHIHIRGGIRNLGPKVRRGFLAVATAANSSPQPDIPKGSSGRLELAEWVTSPSNPLTARVYVNRVWHHLFGRGIASTTDNLGEMGQRPSHPELLDHLASQFISNGWSTKKLIREIMLSSTYKMSSTPTKAVRKADPDNKLFSRQNRRRLEVEAIRDAILLTSGKLDLRNDRDNRRSLYEKLDRNKIPEMFDVFDFPNPNLVSGVRNTSTVPTQALYLLNNAFVMNESKSAAGRLLADKSLSINQRLTHAYRTTLGRDPSMTEKALALEYLGQHSKAESDHETWAGIFHSLYACLDFRYLN